MWIFELDENWIKKYEGLPYRERRPLYPPYGVIPYPTELRNRNFFNQAKVEEIRTQLERYDVPYTLWESPLVFTAQLAML